MAVSSVTRTRKMEQIHLLQRELKVAIKWKSFSYLTQNVRILFLKSKVDLKYLNEVLQSDVKIGRVIASGMGWIRRKLLQILLIKRYF